MLNSAAPICNAAIAAPAPPNQPAVNANDGQAFAQALDHATARQRDATPDAGTEAATRASGGDTTKAPAQGGADATDMRPGARAAAGRKAATADRVAAARAEAAPESAEAPPVEGPPERRAREEDAPQTPAADTDTPPPDLTAWVSSLPLPRPAAAAVASAKASATVTATEAPSRARAAGAAVDDSPATALAREAAAPAGMPATKDDASSMPAPGGTAQAAPARPADARGAHATPAAAADAAAKGQDAVTRADSSMQAFAAQREAAAPQPRGADDPLALPALPTQWPGTFARAADTGTPLHAELKAAVGSKEFAPALGSQLSVLVRDGIEHAQLKLNPADMGPIEVRISLDGAQAQVDFSAAHAATRQALQDAVPALASALRESGLTLTGGGVFEQPRDSRGDARPDSARGAPGSGAGGAQPELPSSSTPLPRLPRGRGVVDLYA